MSVITKIKDLAVQRMKFMWFKPRLWFVNKERLLQTEVNDPDLIDSVYSQMVCICNEYLSKSNKNYTHVFNNGLPSNHGALVDAMEGMTRLLPLVASIAVSKKSGTYNKKLCTKIIKRSILNGTDSKALNWGVPGNHDQRMVEASDIAIALWVSMDLVWNKLEYFEQKQIVGWLEQFLALKAVENNWLLFKLTINVVLNQLTKSSDSLDTIDVDYTPLELIESWHVGGGWFRDGEEGAVDYYTAWGFCYGFFWLAIIDPKLKHLKKYIQLLNENYIYLFSNQGAPLFGRSVCYKAAILVPLVSASLCDHLKKINIKPFEVFSKEFFETNKLLVQGFLEDNHLLVDSYSGPNSALWGLRPYIQLLYMDNQDSAFSERLTSEALPVEIEDFKISPNSYIDIVGDKSAGLVTVHNSNAFHAETAIAVKSHSKLNLIASLKEVFQSFLVNRTHEHEYYSLSVFRSDNNALRNTENALD